MLCPFFLLLLIHDRDQMVIVSRMNSFTTSNHPGTTSKKKKTTDDCWWNEISCGQGFSVEYIWLMMMMMVFPFRERIFSRQMLLVFLLIPIFGQRPIKFPYFLPAVSSRLQYWISLFFSVLPASIADGIKKLPPIDDLSLKEKSL